MNKNTKSGLTDSDKELLRIIGNRFDLAEQIFGSEPAIYFEFNIKPPSDTIEPIPAIDRRQGVFSKAGAVKPKEA